MEAFISKQIIKNGIIREKDELTRPNLVTEKLKSAMAVYGPKISAAALFGLCSFQYSTTSIYLSVYKGSGRWVYKGGGTAVGAGSGGAAGRPRPYGSMYWDEMTPDGFRVDPSGAWME